jgi:hypothetical protein
MSELERLQIMLQAALEMETSYLKMDMPEAVREYLQGKIDAYESALRMVDRINVNNEKLSEL